jgi:hypothetical protein
MASTEQDPPTDGLSRRPRAARDDEGKTPMAHPPGQAGRDALSQVNGHRPDSKEPELALASKDDNGGKAPEVDAGMVQPVPSSVSVVDFDSTRRVGDAPRGNDHNSVSHARGAAFAVFGPHRSRQSALGSVAPRLEQTHRCR